MNTKHKGSSPPPAVISMRDIYYILFRHKWLITILSLLGVATSLAIYFSYPFPYTSGAKILVRYIQETTGSTEMEGNSKVRTPDDRGAGILNTEVQILTSRNLALQVATALGTEKVLGKGSDTNDIGGAASFISGNLRADVQKDCPVILLQFSAKDPTVVVPILTELINQYKKEYFEIHLAQGGSGDYLDKKKEEAKTELSSALQALTDTKTAYGITSVEDARRNAANLVARTQDSIFRIEEDLAGIDAAIKGRKATISGIFTNKLATNHSADAALAASAPPSQETVSKYNMLLNLRNSRRAAEQALLTQFMPDSNPQVRSARDQTELAEHNVRAFEDKNPGLLALRPGELNKGASQAPFVDPEAGLRDDIAKQIDLLARYAALTNQLAKAQQQIAVVDAAENKIMEQTSVKDAADAKYKRSVVNADQANFNTAMSTSLPTNMPTIETPLPPSRDMKQMYKMTLGALSIFLALAFGLPFFIEMILDQSLKSPMDVKARIDMPFFITIPRLNGEGKRARLKRANNVPLLAAQSNGSSVPGTEDTKVAAETNGQIAPWDQRHELRPFFETLRDRLMTYFEMINLTHKPKLVAVTSCGPGAGVTTTAAGLASSLSEIGEGNVLLVSMNVRDGEAHHFYKGKLACGIEDLLEKKNRDQAQVQNNLFVAEEIESDDRLPRVLPKRFSHLVPMMKASDYDYIIFDMPPVSEISITPRLARFMDMVLLVVESEKTSRDAAANVASLLAESKTNVGLVLNKNRSYVPKRFEQVI